MWKKDYPTMLRAFAAQRQGVLLIAGEGPEEAALRALARELEANVRFLGLRADVPELMNAANGFLLSSVVEGLPMALLEAASSALPCVATDAGGVGEIVLDGQTGYLVPPGDPAAFGAAMSSFGEHDSKSAPAEWGKPPASTWWRTSTWRRGGALGAAVRGTAGSVARPWM